MSRCIEWALESNKLFLNPGSSIHLMSDLGHSLNPLSLSVLISIMGILIASISLCHVRITFDASKTFSRWVTHSKCLIKGIVVNKCTSYYCMCSALVLQVCMNGRTGRGIWHFFIQPQSTSSPSVPQSFSSIIGNENSTYFINKDYILDI